MALFTHPFNAIISGPSQCGKTEFVKKFLNNLSTLVDVEFQEIIWYFGESHPKLSNVNPDSTLRCREGLPQPSDFPPPFLPRLLVVDDLMQESGNTLGKLFTRMSHHRNLSVIYITQNLFHQGRDCRDMSLSAHYLVLFKCPRDATQIHYLSRQLYPERPKFVMEAFRDATAKPHGYIFIDLKQHAPGLFRVRSDLFDRAGCCTLYLPHGVKSNVLEHHFIIV